MRFNMDAGDQEMVYAQQIIGVDSGGSPWSSFTKGAVKSCGQISDTVRTRNRLNFDL
jgi:hypothetical protein